LINGVREAKISTKNKTIMAKPLLLY